MRYLFSLIAMISCLSINSQVNHISVQRYKVDSSLYEIFDYVISTEKNCPYYNTENITFHVSYSNTIGEFIDISSCNENDSSCLGIFEYNGLRFYLYDKIDEKHFCPSHLYDSLEIRKSNEDTNYKGILNWNKYSQWTFGYKGKYKLENQYLCPDNKSFPVLNKKIRKITADSTLLYRFSKICELEKKCPYFIPNEICYKVSIKRISDNYTIFIRHDFLSIIDYTDCIGYVQFGNTLFMIYGEMINQLLKYDEEYKLVDYKLFNKSFDIDDSSSEWLYIYSNGKLRLKSSYICPR